MHHIQCSGQFYGDVLHEGTNYPIWLVEFIGKATALWMQSDLIIQPLAHISEAAFQAIALCLQTGVYKD